MLKKFLSKLLAVALVLGVFCVGTSSTEAAGLKKNQTVKPNTALIVVEDLTGGDYVKVTNLSHIGTISEAVEWLEKYTDGKKLRFVSVDAELLNSWKNAAADAFCKVRNEKQDNKKISEKAQKMLKKGKKYSFEIKSVGGYKWGTSDIDRTRDTIQDLKNVFRR